MRQTITISIAHANSYDIQVDDEQRIKTTLHVMKENLQGVASFLNDVEVREKRSGRKIDVNQTYKEAKIYTGFELMVTSKKS